MRKLVLSIIIGCCINTSVSAQTQALWLDDLKIKSFSEGIPAVLGKTNAAGDSIKMKGKYFGLSGCQNQALHFFHSPSF
jgi:alpha-galactosidase